MSEQKWKRVGTRLCALSMTAMLALTPAMAQAMTEIEVVDKGENAYSIKTTLEEGLNEKPVTIKILDKSKEEADQILSKIPKGAWFCVFTPEGKLLSSEDFANQLKTVKNTGKSSACFLIGSSFGMAPSVKQTAGFRLSMGPMTPPHH